MHLTVVGGGLTGLVAAIEAAELGWGVTVHEARSTLGGRARTLEGSYRPNRGPHALYADGPLWAWLEQRSLTPRVVAPCGEALFRFGGRLQPRPSALAQAIASLPTAAPVEDSFRNWLSHQIDDAHLVEAIIGLTFILTLDHDPGRLSAAFVRERLGRGAEHVRYVEGGWGRMIDGLVERALDLGVRIQHRSRVRTVNDEPTIMATSLSAARRFTGDRRLVWPGTRTAFFDVGLGPLAKVGWFRLFDLDHLIYAARYSEPDPTLAPKGHHLIQIAGAIERQEPFNAAIARIHDLLDSAVGGWRDNVQWKRAYELSNESGAIDLPGTSWHDRPSVVRTHNFAIATDQSAAPGLFSEVAHNAARSAIASFREIAISGEQTRRGSRTQLATDSIASIGYSRLRPTWKTSSSRWM